MNSGFLHRIVWFAAAAFAPAAVQANVNITPYYEAPGVQAIGPTGIALLCGSSTTCNIGTETFDSLAAGALPSGYVSTFPSNGPITGTFTGNGQIHNPDQYGAAGGTGKYLAVTPSNPVTLTLNQGVNFFGLWFSALDSTNTISFYNGSTFIYSFGASQFQALVGNCPSGSFCGNPNSNFLGLNNNQQYAFLDFAATGGTFDKVVISEGNSGNFEADNETVGFVSNIRPTGTSLTPEPGGLAFIGAGVLTACFGLRRLKPTASRDSIA